MVDTPAPIRQQVRLKHNFGSLLKIERTTATFITRHRGIITRIFKTALEAEYAAHPTG